MKSREDLHTKLVELLGSNHVYYQPPESVKLVYPCIIYSTNGYKYENADDLAYLLSKQYQIMVITKDPDSDLFEKVATAFSTISFATCFVKDNLYHEAFNLYY